MRGPHILFLSRSKGIKISGVKLRRASNYAFMSYDIERASFDNLLVEEGWDGIHIRGGKISVSEIAVFIRVMMLLRVDYGRIW